MRHRSLADQRREDIIRELGQHRYMTVDDLATAIRAPYDAVGHLLPRMRKVGVVDSRRINKATNTWFLTPKGARAALAGGLIDPPVKFKVPESVVGGTYAVHHERENTIGQKIKDLAEARGDLATWDLEVKRPQVKPIVITDLVLQYERRFPDGSELETLFIEVDRGMAYRYPAHKLIAKLRNYERLMKDRDLWEGDYTEFPLLLVVMEGASKERLNARIRTVSGELGDSDSRLRVRFVVKDDLDEWTPDDLPPLFDDSPEEVAS